MEFQGLRRSKRIRAQQAPTGPSGKAVDQLGAVVNRRLLRAAWMRMALESIAKEQPVVSQGWSDPYSVCDSEDEWT